MNIIDERNNRTTRRKIAKKEYDRMINLSVSEPTQKVRLLDEGAVVMANGEIDFVIKKGTLEKYLAVLPDDYVGSINLGHLPFAEFPILLGTWTKKDLSLVDIGEGRKGLDVELHLDYDNLLVKELSRVPYSLGVSAEFQYHIDEESSRALGVEVLDEIFIKDFAIVGEAGNVNSSDINLNMKGDTKVTLKELNEKLGIQEEPEVIEEPMTDPEPTEEAEAEAEVEAEVEEVAEEETEEPETEDETDKMLAVMADVIEKQNAVIESLTEKVDALVAAKEAAEKELAVKVEKENARLEKFKTLYPSLAEEPETVVEEKVVLKTDGIGEW